jgi:alpha-galactosidase
VDHFGPGTVWCRSFDTDEHTSQLFEPLETEIVYRGHFNVKNGGTIKNAPENCIVKTPGFVVRFGINMVEGVTLPDAGAASFNVSVAVQRLD